MHMVRVCVNVGVCECIWCVCVLMLVCVNACGACVYVNVGVCEYIWCVCVLMLVCVNAYGACVC